MRRYQFRTYYTLIWIALALFGLSFIYSALYNIEEDEYRRSPPKRTLERLETKLTDLERLLSLQNGLINSLSQQLNTSNSIVAGQKNLTIYRPSSLLDNPSHPTKLSPVFLPILLIACNRVTVAKPLDKLIQLKRRFIQPQHANDAKRYEFPIVVSHGCPDSATAKVLSRYKDDVTLVQHVHKSQLSHRGSARKKAETGYSRAASHFKAAIDRILTDSDKYSAFDALIVLEDDLDLADDFLQYFAASHELLLDHSYNLFCVSAWNDNGRAGLIDLSQNHLMYRTDFFPGLGWMLTKSFWLSIRDAWPLTYWDEYMRKPYVSLDRACLRPEISRTYTFGRKGISSGQYFSTYLESIVLNNVSVDFLAQNLSYLRPEVFDSAWHEAVYLHARPVDDIKLLLENRLPENLKTSKSLRFTYTSRVEFEEMAKALKLMDDVKSGVFRTAYKGVVSVFWQGRRTFLAPPWPWTGYNRNWV